HDSARFWPFAVSELLDLTACRVGICPKHGHFFSVAKRSRTIFKEWIFGKSAAGDSYRLNVAWFVIPAILARGLQSELHELRADIFGGDPFELGSASAALHRVAGENLHLRSDVSFLNSGLLRKSRSGSRAEKCRSQKVKFQRLLHIVLVRFYGVLAMTPMVLTFSIIRSILSNRKRPSAVFGSRFHQKMDTHQATELLIEYSNGKREAIDDLLPLIYDELKRVASNYLRRERSDHTLQPTALVNEAYMKMVDITQVSWQ